MSSLDIITFKKTIKDYVDNQKMPKEVARLVLKEIYDEVSREAIDEAMAELNKKGEENDGN